MSDDRTMPEHDACPAWLSALSGVALRRIVIAACALFWVGLLAILLS